MTSRWGIFFSSLALFLYLRPLAAGSVSGRVELRDSRDPVVRKKSDFSGVVISLKEIAGTPVALRAGHATMLQKDKMFTPHVLPISVGTSVDFPNSDPIFH